jgi:hypothetical protein
MVWQWRRAGINAYLAMHVCVRDATFGITQWLLMMCTICFDCFSSRDVTVKEACKAFGKDVRAFMQTTSFQSLYRTATNVW